MPNFLFDARLDVTFRLNARDEASARQHLRKLLDCADLSFGTGPDGAPITSEVTLNYEPVLVEEDGEAVVIPTEQAIKPRDGEDVIGATSRYRLFSGPSGFRLVRVEDGMEAVWHGDDACETFVDTFKGDPDATESDEIADNHDAVNELGEHCEFNGLLSPIKRAA